MSAPSPLPEGVRRDLERMAGPLAERMLPPRVTQSATTRNVVAAVNDDGTVDVSVGGAVMQRVAATTSCAGVKVGDEVIVARYGPRLYAVGVIAKSLDAIPSYQLPAATAQTRGGIRVGTGLTISGDVLSVDNGAYVKALWTGSAAGSVTLSASAAGFRALVLTIGASDGVPLASSVAWSPNGRTVGCSAAFVVDNGTWRSVFAKYRVSGTSMTCTENYQWNGSSVVSGGGRLLSVAGLV